MSINPDGISRPLANYSHVVTAEGAQNLVFCGARSRPTTNGNVLPPEFVRVSAI